MLDLHFDPFPTLKTERLILRRPVDSDVPDLFRIRSDADVMRYIPRTLAQTHDDVRTYLAKLDEMTSRADGLTWAIATADEPERLMGTIGFVNIYKEHHRSEVGYALHPDYQRKGYVQEALVRVLDYGFGELGFHTVEAIVDPANEASSSLLEKNGFIQEAHFRENRIFEGRFLDCLVYTRWK
ncbi:GNAT family N-acetyltransferase [Siphonobacter aquaeclarae]|jgi:ribosomal-protein-alanine N-acetyltransferase|uniref:Ribosomal-protein-alanine N-acetyltransferase n=1 Tax=Siphonobacter aquaeclarae TaxID=563176 RepID=A0A1G9RZA5_9BACT|nr:GNAT family N-acetyltransferase [Siphonobacter aquaeclarae]SDM28589.1 ribosomal-protein-alanine N-acetyltransferase [Siphonobacter aquaeclarae]